MCVCVYEALAVHASLPLCAQSHVQYTSEQVTAFMACVRAFVRFFSCVRAFVRSCVSFRLYLWLLQMLLVQPRDGLQGSAVVRIQRQHALQGGGSPGVVLQGGGKEGVGNDKEK